MFACEIEVSEFDYNQSLRLMYEFGMLMNSNREISGYAEIIVVRHGETAWNADGRIQVNSFLLLIEFNL